MKNRILDWRSKNKRWSTGTVRRRCALISETASGGARERFKFVWDIFVSLRIIKLYKIFDITKLLHQAATV